MDNKIEKFQDTVEITTDAGTFGMAIDLYNHYYNNDFPKKEHFGYTFARILSRATIPESFAAENASDRWYINELDEAVKQMVKQYNIQPRQYVSKYHGRTEKTEELWDLITDEIKDMMTRNSLFGRFSSNGVDRMNWNEHSAVAGSFNLFFNNVFMGGYSPDENVLDKARYSRQVEVLDQNFKYAFIVFQNNDNYRYQGMSHIFATGRQLEQMDQTVAREVLGKIYDMDNVDYARAVTSPTQYDDDQMAIPEIRSLEFLKDKEIVHDINSTEILSILRPIKDDLVLADIIGTPDTNVYVGRKTEGSWHLLYEIPETKSWFERYHERIFQELDEIL